MSIIDLMALTLPDSTWWNRFFKGHGRWIILNTSEIKRAAAAARYHDQ